MSRSVPVRPLLLLLLLLFPGQARAQLTLPGFEDDTVGFTLAQDEGERLRRTLAGRATELQAQLDRQQSIFQWQVDRLDRERAALAETLAEYQRSRRSLPRSSQRRVVLTELIAVSDELDGVLSELLDLHDEQLRSLFAGLSTLNRLGLELDPGAEADANEKEEVEARLEALTDELAVAQSALGDAERRLAAAQRARADSRRAYEDARIAMYRVELQEPDATPAPTPTPAPVVDEDGVPQPPPTPTPVPTISRAEQELRQLQDDVRRQRLVLLDRTTDLNGKQVDLIQVQLELARLEPPVLRYRIERWESRIEDIRGRDGGGVLTVEPGLVRREVIDRALAHTAELALDPPATFRSVRARIDSSTAPRPETGKGAYLIMGLLGLLALGLVGRVQRLVARWRPEGRLDRLLLNAVTPALPLLPVTLVCSGLTATGLVPPVLAPLYSFSAIAPLLAAVVIGLVEDLFPRGGEGQGAAAAGYMRGLLRVGVVVACLLQLVLVLLPLFGYPAEIDGLVRALFVGWVLLGWLGVVLRKGEVLALLGIHVDDPGLGVLRAGLLRFYRVLALGPVVVFAFWAAGYVNLAALLFRGGLTTVSVLLLAPWVMHRVRRLTEHVLGYPDGGGWLALTPEGARAAFRALAPLQWLVIGMGSATLLASGWDYQGDVLGNLTEAFRTPFIVVGGSNISLSRLVLLGLTLSGTVLAVGWVSRWLEEQLTGVYDLDTGTAAAIETLVRYLLYAIGFLSALVVAGVGTGILTVFASVLGIGIGFGSQTVAANFISGLMLLTTRRVSVDDVIEVDGLVGRVVRITGLATVVRTLDNLMVIVPNATLVDTNVINWSVDDDKVRMQIPVGVAYGSDVGKVRQALLQVCEENPRVLRSPRPGVRFDDFADSALVFTVLPWINDPDQRFNVASELRMRIDDRFRREGIEIAFPQLDVHLPGLGTTLEAAVRQGFEVRTAAGDVLNKAGKSG